MSVMAPVRIPVELRTGGPRWFRLAHAVSEGGLLFPRALPEELEGAFQLTFHLPDDPAPLSCRGRVIEVDADADSPVEDEGRPVRRAVRFIALVEENRARIAHYVEERVPR